ncbi:MAG TPA: class II aldolase/adducin family protein [Kofleriaceae bacterium]
MKTGQPLRHEIAEVARELHARGWVANHDGNVSARDGARFLATPTATSKRRVTERDIIELDAKGAVVGRGKVFGEIGLHLAVYERRPDIGCVIHAHPPSATAIASSRGNLIERPFIAEALVSIGPRIPKIAYAQPGEPAKAALAPWCELVDAVLLGNHGVLAWGADPEQAYLRLELVEHLARIALAAVPLGGVEPLPDSAIAPLLAARAKAGIGRAADRAVETAQALLGSAPSGATAAMLSAGAASAAAGATAAMSATAGAPAATSAAAGATAAMLSAVAASAAATAAAATRAAGAAGAAAATVKPVVACAPAPHSTVPTIAPGGSRDLATVVREEIVRALKSS